MADPRGFIKVPSERPLSVDRFQSESRTGKRSTKSGTPELSRSRPADAWIAVFRSVMLAARLAT